MDLEIYLHYKSWLCDVLDKKVFEVECNDMIFGDVYLEDHVFDTLGCIDWYKTVRFVRFDGEIFKRTLEMDPEGAWDGWDVAQDVAEELVTDNLTEFLKGIRSKIKVNDSMDSQLAEYYDVRKSISVGDFGLSFKKDKENWWYELKSYDTGAERQINFINGLPENDEELIDYIFDDILQLVLFNKGKVLPDNTERSKMIEKWSKWAQDNLEGSQLHDAIGLLRNLS